MGRVLGPNGIEVSEIGFGCWAIGGPVHHGRQARRLGEVDDDESVAAVRHALKLGITFFDTADVYGAGRRRRSPARSRGWWPTG
jgi:aryl-alcohol dehydrogenase-like predicted oxidoreductase